MAERSSGMVAGLVVLVVLAAGAFCLMFAAGIIAGEKSQLVEAYGSVQGLFKAYLDVESDEGLTDAEVVAVEQQLSRDAILLAVAINGAAGVLMVLTEPLEERLDKIEAAVRNSGPGPLIPR